MLPLIYDGSGQPAPERIMLRAGRLTMQYEAGMLRYIRLGRHELVRAIYAAVRDHNWGTVPGVLRDIEMDIQSDSFKLTFTSEHQQGDIHFRWRGAIIGTPDSALSFTFDGEALSAFRRNRVGFCVLHPMDAAGKAVEIDHVDGSTESGEFPQAISPHQPFFNIRTITHEVAPGLRAEVRMEGDAFEMEDQRNWTDASFKTYCTPLRLPFPVLLEAGTRVQQSIHVRAVGDGGDDKSIGSAAPTLHLNADAFGYVPPMGLGCNADGSPLTQREIGRLRALHLNHMRCDLHFSAGWQARLQGTLQEAQQISLHLKIELALHFSAGERMTAEVEQLKAFLTDQPVNGWLLVFREGEKVTQPATYQAVVEAIDFPLIGLGTDAFFTELNRDRPDERLETLIAYSLNPQVHAFDNASLVETLPAMGETVASALEFTGEDAEIAITPITLKMRWNPNATAPEGPTPPGQLPRQVDPRQMSLFGAGWTMGAIAALAMAGAHSVTFYEATGSLGVMERESGSPLPQLFPSTAGGVFPMYHVFADAGEFAAAKVLEFTSSQPLQVSGLALQQGDRLRLLVANHTQEWQSVTITGINGPFALKSLDETTADEAIREPEQFRAAAGDRVTAGQHGLTLELRPYAVVRLDATS